MMASNGNERLNRSLTPEVIGGSDPVAEYDKREAGGTIGVVAGMLIALPSEAWHNVLPEVGQQAIIFGGTAVAIGGCGRYLRLSDCANIVSVSLSCLGKRSIICRHRLVVSKIAAGG